MTQHSILLKKSWLLSSSSNLNSQLLFGRVQKPQQSLQRGLNVGRLAKNQIPVTTPTTEKSRAAFSGEYRIEAINVLARNEDSKQIVTINQFHQLHSVKLKGVVEFRWRQLILWLTTVNKFKIGSIRHDEYRKNIENLKPQISIECVGNILQVISDRFMPEKERFYLNETIWLELMAHVLSSHPDQALSVLENTTKNLLNSRYMPQMAIANIIQRITIYHFRDTSSKNSKKLTDIAIRIYNFLDNSPFNLVPQLGDYCSFFLLSTLPQTLIKNFYLYLSNKNESISIWTLMQFGSRLAKAGYVDLAFEVVQKLSETNCHLSKPNTLSICTSLLHNTRLNQDVQKNVLEIFKFLDLSGFKPNVFLYNVVLQSILQNQGPQNSWMFYENMVERGIKPDTATHSILLNDAKRRMDFLALNRVMKNIQRYGQTNQYIVTDIIHTIYLLHQKQSSAHITTNLGNIQQSCPVFDRMLQVYIEYFKIDQLFLLLPRFKEACSISHMEHNQELWDPPAPTLCVMISGFLEFLDSHGVKLFYENFRNLVRTGNPVVAPLIETTYIYNIILMSFYKFEDRAKDAPNVIADMLSPNRIGLYELPGVTIKKSSVIKGEEVSKFSDLENPSFLPHSPAKPDVYTWSILIKIFMRLRLTRSAEKVLAMMARRNIKPEIVTWTSLIAGYARMQNIRMTANAVQRFEEDGFQPDEFIHQILSKLHPQKDLINAMQCPLPKTIKPVAFEWIESLKEDLALDMMETSTDY